MSKMKIFQYSDMQKKKQHTKKKKTINNKIKNLLYFKSIGI